MDFSKAIEIAQRMLKEQELENISFTQEFAESMYHRVMAHVNEVLPSHVIEDVGFDERCLAGTLIGYKYAEQVKDKCTFVVPFGPTTINVSMSEIGYIFNYFTTYRDFLDHCPQVKYWNQFLQKDSEGKEIILSAISEYKPGLYLYSGFYLLGEDIFSENLANRDKQDRTSVFKIENEEIKAKVLDLDPELLTDYLTKVDTYVDKKEEQYLAGTTKSMNIGVYDLFKGIINNVSVAFVRCYCPSTDRRFLLEVEDHYTNAKDAIASLCQVPKVLKDKINFIQRNGEVYHFDLDESDVEDINNGKYSEKELMDLVSLDGDTYFNKMRFEY